MNPQRLTIQQVEQLVALLLRHGYGELRVVFDQHTITYAAPTFRLQHCDDVEGWHMRLLKEERPSRYE